MYKVDKILLLNLQQKLGGNTEFLIHLLLQLIAGGH